MQALITIVHLMFGGVPTGPAIADGHYITCFDRTKVCSYKLVKTEKIVPSKPQTVAQTFRLDVPQF